VVVSLRPPAWEWSFFEDGNLALDRHELWEEPGSQSGENLSQSRLPRPSLQRLMSSATVPRMPPPRAPGRAARARRSPTVRRVQRFAGLTLVMAVLVVTLVLTAFGTGSAPQLAIETAAAPTPAVGASGLPLPQIVATHGPLRIQMPVPQSHVTAVGYHGAGEGALRLQPLGKRGNQGVLGRLRDRIFGAERETLVWYQLAGGRGPATSSLAVGAAPDTDVFSPVDGTVVGISELVFDKQRRGVRVDIQPSGAPSLVVSVSRLRADPALTVGSPVASAKTRIGIVLDLSRIERQALARYTQDAGNHVSIEVRPAATLSLP
jgi:hypothetical protein